LINYTQIFFAFPAIFFHFFSKTGFSALSPIALCPKRKAKHSGSGMKEIAYYPGFEDMAHFSKFFKNKSGMNFTDFKRLAVTGDWV